MSDTDDNCPMPDIEAGPRTCTGRAKGASLPLDLEVFKLFELVRCAFADELQNEELPK